MLAERCTCSHLQTKLQNQSHGIQSHYALRMPAVQRIEQPRHVTPFDGLQPGFDGLHLARVAFYLSQLSKPADSFATLYYTLHSTFVL